MERGILMASLASNAYAKVDEEVLLRGKRLRSRVYLPAHQPGLADDGLPGDRHVDYHRRRARAGLGMQITGRRRSSGRRSGPAG